jgi:hypothetical protein
MNEWMVVAHTKDGKKTCDMSLECSNSARHPVIFHTKIFNTTVVQDNEEKAKIEVREVINWEILF